MDMFATPSMMHSHWNAFWWARIVWQISIIWPSNGIYVIYPRLNRKSDPIIWKGSANWDKLNDYIVRVHMDLYYDRRKPVDDALQMHSVLTDCVGADHIHTHIVVQFISRHSGLFRLCFDGCHLSASLTDTLLTSKTFVERALYSFYSHLLFIGKFWMNGANYNILKKDIFMGVNRWLIS